MNTEDYDIADPKLATDGARRIEWAGRRMTVLKTIRERFLKEEPLKGLTVAACLRRDVETRGDRKSHAGPA